jgi:hypothetical protein
MMESHTGVTIVGIISVNPALHTACEEEVAKLLISHEASREKFAVAVFNSNTISLSLGNKNVCLFSSHTTSYNLFPMHTGLTA